MSNILDFSIVRLPKVTLYGRKAHPDEDTRSQDIFTFWRDIIEHGFNRDFFGLERYMYYNAYSGFTSEGGSPPDYLAGKVFMRPLASFALGEEYDNASFGPCLAAKAIVKGDYAERDRLTNDAHRLAVTRINSDYEGVTVSPGWRLEMFTPDYFDNSQRKHALLTYVLPLEGALDSMVS